MNFGMTLNQAIVTWLGFIVATVALGYVAFVYGRRWLLRGRARSFNGHVREALAVSNADRKAEIQALREMWEFPASRRTP